MPQCSKIGQIVQYNCVLLSNWIRVFRITSITIQNCCSYVDCRLLWSNSKVQTMLEIFDLRHHTLHFIQIVLCPLPDQERLIGSSYCKTIFGHAAARGPKTISLCYEIPHLSDAKMSCEWCLDSILEVFSIY